MPFGPTGRPHSLLSIMEALPLQKLPIQNLQAAKIAMVEGANLTGRYSILHYCSMMRCLACARAQPLKSMFVSLLGLMQRKKAANGDPRQQDLTAQRLTTEAGKVCKDCREFKVLSGFSLHATIPDGRGYTCRTCAAVRVRLL